jgi:hypothetical protein
MEPGELVASGEPIPPTTDTPPESSGAQEVPRIWGALILPVVFILATWAVDRFTRSALGDWRYVPTAILGLCALYFTVLAIIVAGVLSIRESDGKTAGKTAPRWLAHTPTVLFWAVIAAALVVNIIRTVHDHSRIDVITVCVIVVWASAIPGSTNAPRSRRHIYRAVGLLLPVWVLAIIWFHLH